MILDFNANGAFDAGDAIIMHYDVQDSSTPPPAGAQLVADLDGAVNGSISVRFRSSQKGLAFFAMALWSSESRQPLPTNSPPAGHLPTSAALSLSGQLFSEEDTEPDPRPFIAIMDH
jgi:hypothetical protein